MFPLDRLRNDAFTLTDLLILVALIAVAASLAVHAAVTVRRRNAGPASVQALSALIRAEQEFRSGDLDGNRKADYWMRDVRGLARFKRPDGSAGLLDDRLADADAAHPDARPHHFHYFLMLERDEEGRPLADESGCGPRLIFCMYPALYPQFPRTSVYDLEAAWWTRDNGGRPVRHWMRLPASQGWARTD